MVASCLGFVAKHLAFVAKHSVLCIGEPPAGDIADDIVVVAQLAAFVT